MKTPTNPSTPPEPTHSPLPFRLGTGSYLQVHNEREKGELHYPIFGADNGCWAHVFKETDARLIVRCVNAFPALVAALEGPMNRAKFGEHLILTHKEVDAARAALELAKEGSAL